MTEITQLLPTIIFALVVVLGVAIFFLARAFLMLWLQALASHAGISLMSLIVAPWKRINPWDLVACKVMAVQADLPVWPVAEMEAHALAGGDLKKVTRALIIANRARIPLTWDIAAVVDLAGRDILDAVQTSVNPKVIDCPISLDGQRGSVCGVAKDGIQLQVQARVTVRTNLLQLVGGATEATIVARVGQGIVAAIGKCQSFQTALGNPMLIATEVQRRGLDAQTAFHIISIDVEQILVGENVGARLQLEQASADIRIAQADAETMRTQAIARQREMQALIQENRALVISREVEVVRAVAQACREGLLRAPPRDSKQSGTTKDQITIRLGA